jgi:hypothetical protein
MGGSKDDSELAEINIEVEEIIVKDNDAQVSGKEETITPTKTDPEWKLFLGIGTLLLLQTWFDIAPAGPWGSARFSNGVIGLTGLGLIYLAWFRFTFKIKGVVPTIDRWKTPKESLPKVAIAVFIFCIMAWLAGGPLSSSFPEPAGMIIGLIGSLLMLQIIYVWLVLGPLADN